MCETVAVQSLSDSQSVAVLCVCGDFVRLWQCRAVLSDREHAAGLLFSLCISSEVAVVY